MWWIQRSQRRLIPNLLDGSVDEGFDGDEGLFVGLAVDVFAVFFAVDEICVFEIPDIGGNC